MIHIPEIAESSAAGSLRDVYADIRQVTGLSFVNLIYRHLATRQDALEWAWGALRPHFVSGAVASAACDLRTAVEAAVKHLEVHLPERRSELPAATIAGVMPVLQSYGVANCMNLVAFTALLGAGTAQGRITSVDKPRNVEHVDLPPLPPLPALQDLAPALVARIHRLNAYADDANPGIVASLYRHLALWSDALAQAEVLLKPMQQRNALCTARSAIVDAVQVVLQGNSMAMPTAYASFDDGFKPVVTRFATIAIPKMLPIGSLLQRAWQTPVQSA